MANSTTTANAGITVPASGSPDDQAGGPIALLTAAVGSLDSALFGITKYTAAGAITFGNGGKGTAVLNAGSAAAMTLATPAAGLPSAGGQDGTRLVIIAIDAFAYTVTTASNKINGSKHVATWTAAVGNSIELEAYGGVWYNVGTALGVALT